MKGKGKQVSLYLQLDTLAWLDREVRERRRAELGRDDGKIRSSRSSVIDEALRKVAGLD